MNTPIPLWKRLLGCSDCRVYWQRGDHDLRTVCGMIARRFWLRVEWLRDLPRSLRWRVANRLASLAQRLRGDQSYELGYGAEANLAGMLEDRVRMWLVVETMRRRPMEGEGEEWKLAQWEADREEMDELIDDLATLAGLAKASTWLEYWKLVRNRDHHRLEEVAKPEFDY